jgi:hypothetical protein
MASELAAALAKVQAALPRITKGETGKVEGVSKAGKQFSYEYKYADLADVSQVIMPLLGQHGLCFTAKPTLGPGGEFVLVYRLLHEGGESEDGMYPLPQGGTPQATGSAITYARRYCLCAVTGVAPDHEDDDAQAAEGTHPHTARVRVTGAEHERLRNGTIERMPGDRPAQRTTSPSEDQWTDQPAGHLEQPPEDRPGTIDSKQLTAMHAGFGELGFKDREKRLAAISDAAGRPVGSSSDLSFREADAVLKNLASILALRREAAAK